jgi:hypothetical protein
MVVILAEGHQVNAAGVWVVVGHGRDLTMQPTIARRSRRHLTYLTLAVVLLTLLVTAAACAASGSGATVGGEPANPRPGEAEGGDDGFAPGTDAPDGLADLADRKIIKTGEITLEVDDVALAIGQVRALALELEGYVGGSDAGAADEPATLILRIPAERFDTAIDRIHDLEGEVRAEATREQDVTSSIVDLEARIRNLEASEQQYRLLVERAEKIEDILNVQQRLDDVRGQIEQLKAQLEQLSGLASLATLTVTLVPSSSPVDTVSEGWDPGATLDSAVAALVGFGQALGTIGIWLLVVGLPLTAAALIVLLVVWRALPAVRRRRLPRTGSPS